MKFKLDDTDFDIFWRRRKIPCPKKVNKKHRCKVDDCQVITTECYVSRIDPRQTGKSRFINIGSGKAVQSHSDYHIKRIGRKISLNRALQAYFNKRERSSIWEQYLERQKIK